MIRKKYKKRKDNNISISFFNRFAIKSMLSIMLFLLFLIGNKKIDNFNEFIYNNIYSNNITFAKFYNIYKTYFGNLFPIKELDDTLVFNESISYIKEEEYLDGVKLTVDDNYLIPSINDGIVIFIGDKDNYHNTIIIQDLNGIEIWYSNINIGNIGIYDYVKKGDYLGEAISNEIYLRFQKNGVREDYKKYI